MTAVVVAMLIIVMVASAVLAAVGSYQYLAGSPRFSRAMRRWRYVLFWRSYYWRENCFHALRLLRRKVAKQLSRPASSSRVLRYPVAR